MIRHQFSCLTLVSGPKLRTDGESGVHSGPVETQDEETNFFYPITIMDEVVQLDS